MYMSVGEIVSRVTTRGARVAVLGLGISGVETARFLLEKGGVPVCLEAQSEEQFRGRSPFIAEVDELRRRGALVLFGVVGEDSAAYLEGVVAAVVSPGVPLTGQIVAVVKSRDIPIIGEFELGVELIKKPSVVVTGSNGKSTTVSLIHAAWGAMGKHALLCGNVGTPVIAFAGNVAEFDLLIGEASSYQLESCSVLNPEVGVFLNLSENHLERHGTLESYLAAKLRLFGRHDSSKRAVLNYDDLLVRSASEKIKSSVVWFGREIPDDGFGVSIEYDTELKRDRLNYRLDTIVGSVDMVGSPLKGLHHRYNAAAALAAFLVMGGDAEVFQNTVKSFAGLPHRTAFVGEWDKRLVINDSKSTTPAATEAALRSICAEYPARPVTILIGGLVKVGSWDKVFRAILEEGNHRSIRVVCFGKDGERLQQWGEGAGIKSTYAQSVADAVKLLFDDSTGPGIALFSPGGASFDEFRDFEARGDAFCRLVFERFALM